MSISSEVRKSGPFAGNGVATTFPFAFKVFAAADVLVVRANSLGVETTLVLGTDYTVSLNSDQNVSPGGTVSLSTVLFTGEKLVLTSQVAKLQPVDLTNSGGFYPKVINDALDRATIQIQQVEEKVSRAWKIPISSDASSADQLMADLFEAADTAVEAANRVDLGALDDAVDQATSSAEEATQSAILAIAARDAAVAGAANLFDSTTAGLAASSEGDYFLVPTNSENASLTLYKEVSGVAVEKAAYPTAAAIITRGLRTNKRVPLFVDQSGNVPVWLTDGMLDAAGIAPDFKAKIIAAITGSTPYQPAMYGEDSGAPLSTDGRSLKQARARMATIKQSGAGRLKVMTLGDSWTTLLSITQKLADMLRTEYGNAGIGWIPVDGPRLDSLTMTVSGWTLFDASTTATPTTGCGIDGHQLKATSTTATISVGGWANSDMTIYYRNLPGTFRWRVDGGSWTTVTSSGAGVVSKVNISGLSTGSAHTLEIDTTGNAGTVAIDGFRAWNSAGVGAEMLKCGNGGLRAVHFDKYAAEIATYAADLLPDVVVLVLGTNDINNASTTAEAFTASITNVVTAVKTAAPGCSFVLVCPADSNGPKVGPALSVLRDAHYSMAIDNQVEFFNGLAAFPLYAEGNALGLYSDDLHLSDTGGWQMARHLFSRFLTVN